MRNQWHPIFLRDEKDEGGDGGGGGNPDPDKSTDNADGGDGKNKETPSTDKPPASEKPEEKPPEEYTLKLEKDSLLSEKDLESISEYAKTNKLSKKDAEALLTRQEDLLGGAFERVETAHKEKVERWAKEIKDRKEFKDEEKFVAKAMEKFGTEDLKKALDQTGYSNYAPLWDLFRDVGKAMSDDKLIEGKPPNEKKEPQTLGEKMYPNM